MTDDIIYCVICKYGPTQFLAERDFPDAASWEKTVAHIVRGELERVTKVYEVDLKRCTSRDVSADMAIDVARVATATMFNHEISKWLRDFIENHCGVGTVLRAAS